MSKELEKAIDKIVDKVTVEELDKRLEEDEKRELEEAIYMCKELVKDYRKLNVFTMQIGEKTVKAIATLIRDREKISKEAEKIEDKKLQKDIELYFNAKDNQSLIESIKSDFFFEFVDKLLLDKEELETANLILGQALENSISKDTIKAIIDNEYVVLYLGDSQFAEKGEVQGHKYISARDLEELLNNN